MLGNTLAAGVNYRPEIKELRRRQKLGTKQTEETKEKIRQANLGRIVSQSTRDKISAKYKQRMSEPGYVHPFKGKYISEEAKNKISIANTGKKRSKAQKEKRSKRMKGNTYRHDWFINKQNEK